MMLAMTAITVAMQHMMLMSYMRMSMYYGLNASYTNPNVCTDWATNTILPNRNKHEPCVYANEVSVQTPTSNIMIY